MPRYGLNNCTFVGNLTKDGEIKTNRSGTSVGSFTVAVTEKAFKQGEEDRVEFIDCAIFGKRADALIQYLKKGDNVAVQGKLRIRKWKNNEGQYQTNVGVYADEIVLLGSKPQQQKEEAPPPADDDDLPF